MTASFIAAKTSAVVLIVEVHWQRVEIKLDYRSRYASTFLPSIRLPPISATWKVSCRCHRNHKEPLPPTPPAHHHHTNIITMTSKRSLRRRLKPLQSPRQRSIALTSFVTLLLIGFRRFDHHELDGESCRQEVEDTISIMKSLFWPKSTSSLFAYAAAASNQHQPTNNDESAKGETEIS